MKRTLFAATAMTLAASAAHAQYSNSYATGNQPYCREFTKVVTIGGRAQSAYGQACQQPDGSWQIVSDDIPSTQPVQYYPQNNYVRYVQPAPVYPVPVAQPYPYAAYPVATDPYYYNSGPVSSFSISFGSWSPYHTRYYNDFGHNWRGRDDWHGRPDWNRGRDDHDDRHDNHGGPGRPGNWHH